MKYCKTYSLLLLLLLPALAQGQAEEQEFLFPVNPGRTNFLSGTMGEMRSTHFHAAIDIKTGGIEGVPIVASKDGYISRIAVRTGGYGNCLYMKHPDGRTTVYAHLREFDGPIADWVRRQQYAKETFEVNLFPQADQFRYQQGETIGLSGNSGSSAGPHLHFEIRSTKEHVLNPLHYGFKEIRDAVPPIVKSIALITLDQDSRINGRFGRFVFPVQREGTHFTVADSIAVTGRIGVEIYCHDKLDGAPNRNGVPIITMQLDGQEVFGQHIDDIAFSEMKYIWVHTSFETMRRQGARYNKLYVDDGNRLRFYETDAKRGIMHFSQEGSHLVSIHLEDAYGNTSSASVKLKSTQEQSYSAKAAPRHEHWEVLDNTLIIRKTQPETDSTATVFANRMQYTLQPAWWEGSQAVYLWDMRQGLPKKVVVGEEQRPLHYKAPVPSGASFDYYNGVVDISFPANTLFDTLYLSHEVTDDYAAYCGPVHVINSNLVPMRKAATITLKGIEPCQDPDRTKAYLIDDIGDFSYLGGDWSEGDITFQTRDLGKFAVMPDTIPPRITPLRLSSTGLAFRIEDDLSGIDRYRLELDGEWVLMHYDYKKNLIWSEPKEPGSPLRGNAKLLVTDMVGNTNEITTTIE